MKPRFNYAHMRRQFYAWHGGQNSPLYAAASSGLTDDVDALARELRQCASGMLQDKANFRWFNYDNGRPAQLTMRAKPYAEWLWLRRVAESLDAILSAPFVHPHDGRTYRAFPWGDK